MEVTITKDITKKISEVSTFLGLRKKEIVNRALLLYLDSIEKYLHLKKEFAAWDSFSDEALLNFEKQI